MAAAAETATPTEQLVTFPDTLKVLNPLDGRYLKETRLLRPYCSEEALIRKRIGIEAKYLIALSDAGIARPLDNPLTDDDRDFLNGLETLADTQIAHVADIEKKTHHDVKAVEIAMGEWFEDTPVADMKKWIHFGLTSEDVNNLARRLMLKEATEKVMLPQLRKVIGKIVDFADETKAMPMLARTHGQPAVPTTLGKELINFASRLHEESQTLASMNLKGKLAGAVGNFNASEFALPQIDWEEFSDDFVTSLGLEVSHANTQLPPYEDMIQMFQTYQRINGIILDLDQDMWRYISDDWFTQKVEPGQVGSSTMAQKINPIDFENSEGNVFMADAMFDAFAKKLRTSRLQRDLSDSTVVRNVGVALGYTLVSYKNTEKGLGKIYPNQEKIHEALTSNWAILSEAVQTYLRTKGHDDAYEIMRKLTQGKHMDEVTWRNMLLELPLEHDDLVILAELTPETYIGNAVELTEKAIEEIRGDQTAS